MSNISTGNIDTANPESQAVTTATIDLVRPADWFDREWTDDDYQLFIDLYAQGALPEILDDPCVWDEYFVLANDRDAPFRPSVISSDDFHSYLPANRQDTYGLLCLKLWEIAAAKGCTRALEEEIAEQNKQKEREEIEALRLKFTKPAPRQYLTLRQQWYAEIMAEAPPDSTLAEKAKFIQEKIIEGQPFRSALLDRNSKKIPDDANSQLMLPESDDFLADPLKVLLEEEQEANIPELNMAPAKDAVHNAALQISELLSVLVARQRRAIGYAPDKEIVSQTLKLARATREFHELLNPKKPARSVKLRERGRPRKSLDPRLLEKKKHQN